MNKKAQKFMAEETVKIVIAVAGIGILILLAVNLAGIFLDKTRIEQAKATMEGLLEKINSLKDDQTIEHVIESPKKWYLVSYSVEEINKDKNKKIPSQCSGKDCLCLCPSDYLIAPSIAEGDKIEDGKFNYFYYGEHFDSCQNVGVCKNVGGVFIESLVSYDIIEIRVNPRQGFGEQKVGVAEAKVNWISLNDVPKKITLSKQNGVVSIK